MGIGTWNRLAQLQFVTFKIFTYKTYKQKKYKKYIYTISSNIYIYIYKQFNLNEINAKSNFDFVRF